MAALTPRPGARHDSITSPHLRSAMFERLDKDRFVRAYIQSQKLHATAYAADGKVFISSWDRQISGTPANQKHHYGFDTPVLKPRVAKPTEVSVVVEEDVSNADANEHEPEPIKQVWSKKPSRPVTKPKKDPSSKYMKENVPPESHNSKIKPVSKKRLIRPDSDDDDHAARLTERRERKRAKRAIVQPKELAVTEDNDDNKKTDKSKKDKKSKIPAGFALMHGFSATNVGKNRLTLKSGPSAGVFGKGKASAKTQIVRNKSKKVLKNAFSEFEFLNKLTKYEPKQTQAKSKSSSLQSEHSHNTSISSAPTPRPQKIIITNRDPSKTRQTAKLRPQQSKLQASLDEMVAQGSYTAADKSKRTAVNPQESELWDMELDDPNSTHGSRPASSVVANQPRDGTIVLDTRTIWAGAQIGSAANDRIIGDEHGDLDAHCNGTDLSLGIGIGESGHRPSSSLCPSESASQYGQPRALRPQKLHVPGPQATSKYFADTGIRVASNVVKEAEVPLRVGSEDFFSEMYYPAISLEKATEEPFVIQPDQNLVTAISDDYHPSQQLVASPPSPDSIEMELQDYMNYTMANAQGATLQFDYEGEVAGEVSDVLDAEYECYNEEGESSVGDPQGWPSGGYEDMDTYPGQQLEPSDIVGYDGLEVEQEIWNTVVAGNDMDGFELYNEEMLNENEIEESEYGSLHHSYHEDTHGTATSANDGDRSVLLTQRFSQGRALLLGFSEPGNALERSSKTVRTVSHAEAAVAKSLREHWLPQKF